MHKKIVKNYPFAYGLGRWMIGRGIKGGYRLINFAYRRGWLDTIVLTQIVPSKDFLFPLYLYPFDYLFPELYEAELLNRVGKVIADFDDVQIVDCGSDIGLLAHRLSEISPRTKKITAVEPNEVVQPILRQNLAVLDVDFRLFEGAVSNFEGGGSLKSPSNDRSSHAKFLVKEEDGQIRVSTVDRLVDVESGDSLLAKIDVEGEELSVVLGAERTIKACSKFCVVFEANRRQIDRTGGDPCDVIRQIREWRSCNVIVAEETGVDIDPNRRFFDQVSTLRDVFNVVIFSS